MARGDGTATSAVGLVRELGTATSAEDWERGRGTKISQVRFTEYAHKFQSFLIHAGGFGKRAWNSNFSGGLGKRAWNSGFTGNISEK